MENPVEHFAIEVDKLMYTPGSFVHGNVHLTTKDNVLCSGVTIEALGEMCTIIDSERASVLKHYESKKTLFGGSYKVDAKKITKDVLSFGQDGGTMLIPLAKRDRRFVLELIGVEGESEKVLGATRLYPRSLIDNCRSKRLLEIPLTTDGATVTATIKFSASWRLTSHGDVQVIRSRSGLELLIVEIHIDSAVLKEISDFSSFDSFFCRAVLPTREGDDSIVLPQAEWKLPFSFRLPEKLPTTIDTQQGSSIRYCLKCSIEGDGEQLPSAVKNFRVVQSQPTSIPVVSKSSSKSTLKTRKKKWNPFSCGCKSTMNLTMQLDNSVYVRGDTMKIVLKGENPFNVPLNIQIALSRKHFLIYSEHQSSFISNFDLVPSLGVPKREKFCYNLEIPFPDVAPTYEGMDGDSMRWNYEVDLKVEARQSLIFTRSTPVIVAASDQFFAESSEPHSPTGAIVSLGLGNGEKSGSTSFKTAMETKTPAVNKIVRNGNIVEVSFIPWYSESL